MKLKDVLNFLKGYLKPYKAKLFLALFLLIASGISAILYGYLFGRMIDFAMQMVISSAVICGGILFVSEIINNWILNYYDRKILNVIGLHLFEKIGFDLYEKIGKLPIRAFEEKNSGEFVNRIVNDASSLSTCLTEMLEIVVSLLVSIFIFIYICFNSWVVAFIILIYLVVVGFVNRIYLPKIKEIEKNIKKEEDNLIAEVTESVHGIREIRALGIRERMNNLIAGRTKSTFQKRQDSTEKNLKYQTTIDVIDVVLEVGAFLTMIFLLINGSISTTFLMAMTYFLYRFMYVFQKLTGFARNYQKIKVAVERILEVLENRSYQDERYGTKQVEKITGNIAFENISFHYHDSTENVLDRFDLTIPKNSVTAIIGKSGQGKSTIFNLLLRFFEANEGEIKIDGISLKDFNEKSLRNHITIIRQEPFLFHKTILENFTLIEPDITLETVRDLCKKAMIDEYFMSLPNQYDTLIGEGGVNLSGGQKQRLAIARALVKKSKILLFDEATSALDNENQTKIKEVIELLSKDHTIIIIAHRLSTIVDANKIYYLSDGKIKNSGTHQELLKTCEEYQRLYHGEN